MFFNVHNAHDIISMCNRNCAPAYMTFLFNLSIFQTLILSLVINNNKIHIYLYCCCGLYNLKDIL